MTTLIDVELKDGRKISGRADFGKGSPAMPMTYDDVAAKFLECAEFARFPSARGQEVVAMVRDLESIASISRLTDLLRVAA
jgi:2-methylcitrate dehydratase PrpD